MWSRNERTVPDTRDVCADREVKRLKQSVMAQVMGISMPFVGVDGTTACDNVYEEDRVTKANCPMTAGTTYVYIFQLKVLPKYPSVSIYRIRMYLFPFIINLIKITFLLASKG